MDRRKFLKISTLSALATAAGLPAAQAKTDKPNLLFIIADDCTYRDIGCYGGQAITPHIDKFAKEGMLFNHCFQAAPMCSPTRHNIYTGQYPVKSGAYPNHTYVKDGVQSVAHYLKPQGYRVALSGKKHINPPEAFPFEFSGKGNNPDMEWIDNFMGECTDSGTPFCLFACSNEPHSPWDKGDASQYDAAKLKLPPYFVDTPETREDLKNYMAEITYYDGQVGDLLDLLDKHGVADNTFVIVVSEQGSSFPFAKWTCYDSGLQSAFIARWPGKIKPGTVSDAMIEYVDVLPTFLEVAGAKIPKVLDGKSLLPVLSGKKKKHKDYVYGEMTTRGINNGSETFGIRSIRSEKFKYVWNFTPEIEFRNACTQSGAFKSWIEKAKTDPDAADKVRRYTHRPGEELFDIQKDPLEWTNLADDPKYASEKKDLRKRLLAWMKDMGDKGQETELRALERASKNRGKTPAQIKAQSAKQKGAKKGGKKKAEKK